MGTTPKVDVLGVWIDPIRLEQVLVRLGTAAGSGERLLVAHVNITGLNLAYEQPWLQQFFNEAGLVFCDGMGVMLGARWLGHAIPERFTLADWIWPLAEMACANRISLYLLGSAPGVAQRAGERLRQRFPDLYIAGALDGFFEKTPGDPANEAALAQINAASPDILLVGMGMPVQEQWLQENWPRLAVPVAITGGAIFEYVSGDLQRGPDWMTQHYLEWLARIWISPRRYFGRYLRDIPLFFFRVLRQRWQVRQAVVE